MEDGFTRSSVSVTPLLESSTNPTTGTASVLQTLGNIIVSIVGTGILGLPFAFKIAGWLGASLGVSIAGIAICYCMLLLVQCKVKISSREWKPETITYGDLGYKSMGEIGRFVTEFLIFISQCGGSVAYLVFIGQNLSSIFEGYGLSFSSFIFMLVPIQVVLSWINSLSALAPFSIFADVCNVLAMVMVLKVDVENILSGEFKFSDRKMIASNISGFPYVMGMAVFCFEGFGMTLALESSMKEHGKFPVLLAKAFSGITFVYVLFGFSGYMAYGEETKDIITLNLPQNWSAIAVQIGLCLGLIFTFPIMVHPVHEIVEQKLKSYEWFQKPCGNSEDKSNGHQRLKTYLSRAILIVGLALVASFVPAFGVFASLVGSSVCALISFVLPAMFHLKLLGPYLNFWEKALDYFILVSGLLFAVYGTYNTISSA